VSVIDQLCRQVRPHFSDHLDGEPLPVHVRVGVRLHLTFCPMCRRTYLSLEQTRAALKALNEQDPAPRTEE
jgi:predicted anti-sigma-YlaC factor YlaD